jgi:hypothetical protein
LSTTMAEVLSRPVTDRWTSINQQNYNGCANRSEGEPQRSVDCLRISSRSTTASGAPTVPSRHTVERPSGAATDLISTRSRPWPGSCWSCAPAARPGVRDRTSSAVGRFGKAIHCVLPGQQAAENAPRTWLDRAAQPSNGDLRGDRYRTAPARASEPARALPVAEPLRPAARRSRPTVGVADPATGRRLPGEIGQVSSCCLSAARARAGIVFSS